MDMLKGYKFPLAAVVVILASALVYSPGLNGPFLFDDVGNFVNDHDIRIRSLEFSELRAAAFSGRERVLLDRPLPRLTFALNYYFGGKAYDSWWFKVTNVAIHAFNGVLVFILSLLLCRSRLRLPQGSHDQLASSGMIYWVAAVTALLWTLHPIQLTSVLYVVQRMTSMAGMFVFLGLILFMVGRGRVGRSEPWGFSIMIGGVLGCTLFCVLCKQNAALLPFFASILELFFFGRQGLTPTTQRRLKLLYGALFSAALLVALVVLIRASDFFSTLYDIRDFTLQERLLTESRVLFMYLGLMFIPRIRDFSLFHDDIAISTGLFSPPTTFLALIGLSIVVGVAIWGSKKKLLVSFAILWFLVGHAIESTVLALEIAHEHRNYVPSFGVFFALGYGLVWLVGQKPELRRGIFALGFCGVLVFSFVTHSRATLWKDRESIAYITARNHPEAPRAQMELGLIHEVLDSDARQVFKAYQRAAASSKNFFPILKLQRIIDGFRKQLATGEQRADDGVYSGSADLFASDLFLNDEFLAQLDRQVDKEARERLAESAVDAETMLAFLEVRRCVLTQTQSCLPARRAIEWHEILLARDDLLRLQRASLVLNLAKLYAYVGDTPRALELAQEAVETSHHKVGFVADLAQLYKILGDYAAAESILRPLLDREDLAVEEKAAIRELIVQLGVEPPAGVGDAGAR